MKLTRKEQQEENTALDNFVDFGASLIEALKGGNSGSVTRDMIEALKHVQIRLARYAGLSLAVTKESKDLAEELKDSPAFKKLIEGGTAKLTKKEIGHLEKAYSFIKELRQLARDRAANLAKGRVALNTLVTKDKKAARRIATIRANNAGVMREKRTSEDVQRGGLAGGPARAEKLSPQERQDIGGLGGSKRGRDKKRRTRRTRKQIEENEASLDTGQTIDSDAN